MKTKCLSCGGSATTKMQNGGLITGAKKFAKQAPIKTIKTIRKALNKLTTRKNKPGCFGAGCTKMQKGGYPVKNFINNNLKPLLKIPTYPGQTYKKDTGRNITEKAAARKVAKGKGFMTYQSNFKSDPEGTGDNRGIFNSNFIGRKPRVVMQNGGMVPRCPGPNCPKKPKVGITKAIKKIVKKTRTIGRNGTKQTDTPYGNFPKDMSQPQPKKMQNGGTADPSQNQIDKNKIKQTGSTWRGGTRSKEVTLDQNLYDPNKNSGAVTKTKRNAAGEIIKQKTRIVSSDKARKKYDKIFNSNNRQTKTCFSGNCK